MIMHDDIWVFDTTQWDGSARFDLGVIALNVRVLGKPAKCTRFWKDARVCQKRRGLRARHGYCRRRGDAHVTVSMGS